MIENCAVLTIAGSDPGGGAGIQADLKTFSAMGVFGTSVVTAITAQNLNRFYDVQPVMPDMVRKQLVAVLEGFPVKAIKTGMLFSAEIIEIIAELLSGYPHIPIVIDPVFKATAGGRLFREKAVETLKERLFPRANLITPNVPEVEELTGLQPDTVEALEHAAMVCWRSYNVPFLLKGGHLHGSPVDILADDSGTLRFGSTLVEGVNTHGSGCTLSAAIAAALARGEDLKDAVGTAKNYITATLKNPLNLAANTRVINHFASKYNK